MPDRHRFIWTSVYVEPVVLDAAVAAPDDPLQPDRARTSAHPIAPSNGGTELMPRRYILGASTRRGQPETGERAKRVRPQVLKRLRRL
jgi:hypothetical protein